MPRSLVVFALVVSLWGCAGREHAYTPRGDRVLELGRDEAMRQLMVLLGRAARPEVEAGSVEVTDAYMYLRTSRAPLSPKHWRIGWDQLAGLRLVRFEEPQITPSKWLCEVVMLDAAGAELFSIQFIGETDGKAFADLAWSLREAANAKR